MTNETDSLVGAVLGGRWRLTRKLGEGGMGAVYAAQGSAGEGDVAVKILHREFVKEEQVVSRFYAEAEASKRLNHPHIARVHESGTAETGEPFLIMELLRGQPLGDACPEGARLPVPDTAHIMKEVLVGLAEAHRQDIVHRDLKPDNIFLCEAPGGGRVAKLLDFGIARVIDAASGGAMRKTKTGMLLGTPGYMSPEQLRNSKTVDPRCDLWSLCTVFYEIISGRDPYGATNDFARLTAVFTQDSIPVDRDAPELAPWREFFQRAFQRDINLRFQTAQEMSEAIDAVLAGRPLPPLGPPLQYQPPGAQPPAQQPQAYQPPPSAQDFALASTQPSGFVVPEALAALPPTTSSPAVPAPVAYTPTPYTPPPAKPAGSGKLVWGLIAVVLVLGAVIVGLAIQSLQKGKSDEVPAPTAPTATNPAAPTVTATGKPSKIPGSKRLARFLRELGRPPGPNPAPQSSPIMSGSSWAGGRIEKSRASCSSFACSGTWRRKDSRSVGSSKLPARSARCCSISRKSCRASWRWPLTWAICARSGFSKAPASTTGAIGSPSPAACAQSRVASSARPCASRACASSASARSWNGGNEDSAPWARSTSR